MKILVIGTGEYVLGLIDAPKASDKSNYGVILPVLFDLRSRFPDQIESILLAGSRGLQMPRVRQHLREGLGSQYENFKAATATAIEATFPEDHVASDPCACKSERDVLRLLNSDFLDKKALKLLNPGDGVIIYTPDNLHYEMAMAAISSRLHVLLAKPAVKTVEEHLALIEASKQNALLAMVDFHKRWDPIYYDARKRIRHLGPLNYFQSFMSQPKSQLMTFQRWIGTASDVSYYLNAHHLDFHLWAMKGLAEPCSVTAFASYGIANAAMASATTTNMNIEDTITLMVVWRSIVAGESNHQGIAQYTASWTAINQAEVHSQQRFHHMAKWGEIQVDQAHRGYQGIQEECSANLNATKGLSYYNPLYMTYLPHSETNGFDGQQGYGYRSIECWIQSCLEVNEKKKRNERIDWTLIDQALPTLESTLFVTKILAAGRQSLNQKNQTIFI